MGNKIGKVTILKFSPPPTSPGRPGFTPGAPFLDLYLSLFFDPINLNFLFIFYLSSFLYHIIFFFLFLFFIFIPRMTSTDIPPPPRVGMGGGYVPEFCLELIIVGLWNFRTML